MKQQFKVIPGFSGYEMNEAGEVRKISTGILKVPMKDNPKQVQLFDDENKRRRIFIKEIKDGLFPPVVKKKKAPPVKRGSLKNNKGKIVVSDVELNFKQVSESRMNPNRIPKKSYVMEEELEKIKHSPAWHFSEKDFGINEKIFILINHFGLSQRLTAGLLNLNIEVVNGKYYRAKTKPNFVKECRAIIKKHKL